MASSCRSKSACTRKRQSKGITAVEITEWNYTEQAVCKMLMKDMKPAAANAVRPHYHQQQAMGWEHAARGQGRQPPHQP